MDAAARQLGYSQPAITYQIKCLERSLGFKLFTRHPSGARLTGDGRMILSSAQAVVMLIDNIRNLRGGEDTEAAVPSAGAVVPMARQNTA
ncbi:LysR family transcriptional regulator [Streptomyces sp. NPDC079020]|uniref:LysR family transcriptional regulator n=1 Tax=Streptomyces sp. NPDC079020 TaxID=3365722 RepID=UPI0037CE527C